MSTASQLRSELQTRKDAIRAALDRVQKKMTDSLILMDLNKSIEEYEHDFWEKQDFPTELIRKVFALRKKKLKDLDASDLRVAIGQGVALSYTVPLAFKMLKVDLMVDADFYPGDLLKSLLEIDGGFWKEHNSLWQEVNSLIEFRFDYITHFEGLNREVKNKLLQCYLQFKKLN